VVLFHSTIGYDLSLLRSCRAESKIGVLFNF
jgi:hypothetical protein